jgi:hypothetical protein
VTQRGNRREPIFFEDGDQEIYRDLLGEQARKADVELWILFRDGEWLLLQNRSHLGTQTIKATAHICYADRTPDLRSSTKFDHLRRLSRIARSKAGSAPLSILISARH